MATRMNMMKLLQEIRGMAEVTNRRPLSRTPAALALQTRLPAVRIGKTKTKRIIHVSMLEPMDIPHPVKIRQAQPSEALIILG